MKNADASYHAAANRVCQIWKRIYDPNETTEVTFGPAPGRCRPCVVRFCRSGAARYWIKRTTRAVRQIQIERSGSVRRDRAIAKANSARRGW